MIIRILISIAFVLVARYAAIHDWPISIGLLCVFGILVNSAFAIKNFRTRTEKEGPC